MPLPEIDPQPPEPSEPAGGLPTNDAAELSSDELAEAKRYGRLELACMLLDKGLDIAYLTLMALVFARPIDNWLSASPVLDGNWPLRLVVLLLIVMGLHVGLASRDVQGVAVGFVVTNLSLGETLDKILNDRQGRPTLEKLRSLGIEEEFIVEYEKSLNL